MSVLEQDSQSKQGGYSMHQLQGNKEFGSEKKGYLMKKSDGYDTYKHTQLLKFFRRPHIKFQVLAVIHWLSLFAVGCGRSGRGGSALLKEEFSPSLMQP